MYENSIFIFRFDQDKKYEIRFRPKVKMYLKNTDKFQ